VKTRINVSKGTDVLSQSDMFLANEEIQGEISDELSHYLFELKIRARALFGECLK